MFGIAGQNQCGPAVGRDAPQLRLAAGCDPEVALGIKKHVPDIGLLRLEEKARRTPHVDLINRALGRGPHIEMAAAIMGQGIDFGFFGLEKKCTVATRRNLKNLAVIAGTEIEISLGIAGNIPHVGLACIDELLRLRSQDQTAVALQREGFELSGQEISKAFISAQSWPRSNGLASRSKNDDDQRRQKMHKLFFHHKSYSGNGLSE